MKPIAESPEVFEAYAIIDCSYFMLKKLYAEMDKPRSVIASMVDDVTGYGLHVMEQHKTSAISLMTTIIENKKIVGADTTSDEAVLAKLEIR